MCVFKSNQAGGAGSSFDRPSLLWQNSLLISQSLQKGIEKESKTQHLNAESKMPTLTQVCCELFSGESLVLMGVLLSLATHTQKDWGKKTRQQSSLHRIPPHLTRTTGLLLYINHFLLRKMNPSNTTALIAAILCLLPPPCNLSAVKECCHPTLRHGYLST